MGDDDKTVVAGGYTLKADAGKYELKGQAVAMIIEGPKRVEVNDFKGTAKGRRLPDGTFELAISDQPPQGRANEPNVFKVFRTHMMQIRGVQVTISPGLDANGEDAIAEIGGERVTLQVVKCPSDSRIGKAIATGAHTLRFSAAQGAAWIIQAIRHKSSISPRDRPSVILLLDARHAGILRHGDIQAELAAHSDEMRSLKFRQIWLVGPTAGKAGDIKVISTLGLMY